MSYQVNWEVRALDRTAGFLRDDVAGVARLWESVSRLADEPRPDRRPAARLSGQSVGRGGSRHHGGRGGDCARAGECRAPRRDTEAECGHRRDHCAGLSPWLLDLVGSAPVLFRDIEYLPLSGVTPEDPRGQVGATRLTDIKAL